MILFNVVEYKTHLQERNHCGSQEGEETNLPPSFGNTYDLCIKKKLQGGVDSFDGDEPHGSNFTIWDSRCSGAAENNIVDHQLGSFE